MRVTFGVGIGALVAVCAVCAYLNNARKTLFVLLLCTASLSVVYDDKWSYVKNVARGGAAASALLSLVSVSLVPALKNIA